MLKNIISKISLRSTFKQQLRKESAYENYKRLYLTDKQILTKKSEEEEEEEFVIDPNILKIKEEDDYRMSYKTELVNEDLRKLGSQINNPLIAPQKKLASTLFDVKNVLQVCFKNLVFYNLVN